MALPKLHIVFSLAAADRLRGALARPERQDQVIAICDDFSFGPINPADTDQRIAWTERVLGCPYWGEQCGNDIALWAAAVSEHCLPVVWMTRRSAQEHAGFLEFIWRRGDLPCEVVDLTNVSVVYKDQENRLLPPRLILGLYSLSPRQILKDRLLESALPVTAAMRDRNRATWRALRKDNADLRVLDADLAFRSASINHFDEELLSFIRPRSLKAARIIGDVISKHQAQDVSQVDPMILSARLHALAKAGLLESQGNLWKIGSSEVRLPAQPN